MESQRITVKLLPDTGEPNSTIFVLGKTGCGKTTLIANLIYEEVRFIIFDTKRDFAPEFFGGRICVCKNVASFTSVLNAGEQRIIVDVSELDDDSQEIELDKILQILQRFQIANKHLPAVTVCLDELNKFVEGQETCHGLREIIQRGRGPRIKKVFGAQWFGKIPTWVRDSFSELYVFQHTDSSGLTRLYDYGFDCESVKTLPMYNCIHCGAAGLKQIELTPDKSSIQTNKEK